jgi:hypothetical protein
MGGSQSSPEPEPELAPVAGVGLVHSPPVPPLVDDRGGECSSDLLSVVEIAKLNQSIGSTEWKRLFSTAIHGTSFTRMVNGMSHKGASLLVVRERAADDGTAGRVFGGFADTSWGSQPAFFGGSRCFLFQGGCPAPAVGAAAVSPIEGGELGGAAAAGGQEGEELPTIYRSVDANRLYLNTDSASYPNVLAFGGQLYDFEGKGKSYTGFWGLSIAKDMSSGTSAECATYANPELPAHPGASHSFRIEALEVWGTDPFYEPTLDEKYEIERKMGVQVDGALGFVLEQAGVAQNAKAAGVQKPKPTK